MTQKQTRWTSDQLEFLRNNYGSMFAVDIAKAINCKVSRVIHKAYELKLRSSLTRRFSEDIHAQIRASGNVPLEPFSHIKQKIRFQCYHCGNEFVTTPYKISSKHTKSCGCASIGKRRGGRHVSKTYYQSIKQGAFVRNMEFNVSITDLDELIERQGFKCALSGRPLIYGYLKKGEQTASLDRINSKFGYVVGNVQFLHKDVNMSKQGMNQLDFINMCKEIANNA